MKNYAFYSLLTAGIAVLLTLTACDDDNRSDLQLDGETEITAFALDGYEGTIDLSAGTIIVPLPEVYDTSAMTVTALALSEGATANVAQGDLMNLTDPQVIRVTNGDVLLDYTVSVQHDEAEILSFKLNGSYTGVIDQTAHTISVRVPTSVDVTAMTVTITTSDGATVSPASGSTVDFTDPVEFTVTYNTATTVYTVTVVLSDTFDVAYVGLASSIDELNYEENEAATWLLNNVANSQYISFAEVAAGNLDFSDCKVIWWHLHIDGGIDSMDKFESNAADAVTAVSAMKELYESGVSFLLTRYATYYAVKLGATIDGCVPNNCWGQYETDAEITTSGWTFLMTDHEDHALYQNLIMDGTNDDYVYTCGSGYAITNSTAQWHIGTDWGDYADYDTWRTNHGGTDIGYGSDGAIVVWEYPTEGYGEGNILCIGSGCYDWYSYGVDTSTDPYHENVSILTENAINYLSE